MLAAIVLAATVSLGSAPADEYFGPFKESVLEIRNRLFAFERDTAWDLRRHLRAIDNVEVAIEDWHRKYPGDPWIPAFSHRMMRVYECAHAGRCRGWRRLVAFTGPVKRTRTRR